MRHLRSFSIYAFTIFFNAAISFGTFSILTHHLTEVDYGIINLYNSLIVFLSPFIAIGTQFILGVDFFRMQTSDFRNHFTNVIVIPVISCILFTVIALFASGLIENYIHVNFFFSIILPLLCLITVLSDIILNLIRDKGKHQLFAIFSISKNVIEIGLTLLFVVALKYSWEGRLSSSFISLILILIFIIYLIKKWDLFSGNFVKEKIKKVIISGLPFIPERLAIFVLVYSDRFFINYYQGVGDVGFYSAGAQLAMIVNLGIIALNNAFYPSLYKRLSDPALNQKQIKKITLSFVAIITLITLAVILATPFFFKYFVGLRFQEGKQYAMFLTMGLFFWGIYNVFLAFLLFIRKNRIVMFISIFGMIVSISMNFLLVNRFGALGATYTSIIVYFFMATCTLFFVHKYYDLRKIFGKISA